LEDADRAVGQRWLDLTAFAVAAAVGKSVLTVRRYMAKRVDGLLKDATRRNYP
jgi:hypothetical protein